jgi:hypothetical protein
MKIIKSLIPAFVLALPFVASAKIQGATDILATISGLINSVIPVIVGLAVLIFIWGLVKYVVAKSDDEQKEAKSIILWGVIALFVMVAVWGLVNVLINTFDLETTIPNLPKVPLSS